MVLPQGVEYEALDDEPVNLIFLIAAPEGAGNVHITILSKLSMMLMDDTFTESLRKAKSVEEFLNIIDAAETEKDDADAAKEKAAAQTDLAADKEKDNQKLILAVTACPTGIAHTYMAAESIEKAAKKKGYLVKVETRGSGGAKNVLTEEEIEAADGIIVAADTNVPMDRFDGKALIECQVSHGINKADELIDTIVSGQAEIYKAAAPAKKSNAQSMSGGVGHTIYKHLMNGVSHMLPFVVGGGILIAIAFLIDGLCIDLNALSAAERANFGTITPIAATFKQLVALHLDFMLPILAGFIAMSIADRPGLVAGFVGGAIAANGTSGFLGALAAGFLAGFIVNLIKKVCEKLPDSLEGIKPVLLYPVFGVLLMGLSMTFIIEPIVGVINTGLTRVWEA